MMPSLFRPALTRGDVPSLILKLYGLEVTARRELDSYDDQNFLVDIISGSTLLDHNTPLCTSGYVFKVNNSQDSQKPDVLELQTQIILHVQRKGYPTPAPVPTVDNHYLGVLDLPMSKSPDDKMEKYVGRLFNFIPGKTLDQVPLTNELCFQVGCFAGKVDVILRDFPIEDNPIVSSLTRKWNMSEIPHLKNKLHVILSEEQQSTVEEIIEQFETRILSCQDKFSKGLIHGDFNDCNILVTDEGLPPLMTDNKTGYKQDNNSAANFRESQTNTKYSPTTPNYCKIAEIPSFHVCGILDFGDTTFSLCLFEVAIAISYVMLNTHGIPPMEAAGQVLAGYCQHVHLSVSELKYLKLCICARFVQSLVIGFESSSLEPENEYILVHAKRIWPVLKSLWETPDSEVLMQLTNGIQCQSFPCCFMEIN